jgi:hypothetical protein
MGTTSNLNIPFNLDEMIQYLTHLADPFPNEEID